MAQKFAKLDQAVRAKCEDPKSCYQIGWSHGIEKLQNGSVDALKGSYYANPLYNVPTKDPDVIKKYPAYARPNIWPTEDMPELEEAFMTLGKIMVRVGALVAHACDKYLLSHGVISKMENIVKTSTCSKARLLHYFPTKLSEVNSSSWCGKHCDHGTLTGKWTNSSKKEIQAGKLHSTWSYYVGICAPMYLNADFTVADNVDLAAGLYIIDSEGKEVMANIPEKAIAFQLGQAAQILSNGLLRATPHFVKAPQNGMLNQI